MTLAATEHCRLCTAQMDEMITNTKKLFHHGLELGLKTWEVARDVLDWKVDDLDHFIIHQVGKAHTEKFARIAWHRPAEDLPALPQPRQHRPRRGADRPVQAGGSRQAEGGDRVALMGIGSGINCSMAELVW